MRGRNKKAGALIFGVKPEKDAIVFYSKAIVQGSASGAGEYAAIFFARLFNHMILDFTHI